MSNKLSKAHLKATNSMTMDAEAVQVLVQAGIVPPGTPVSQIDIFARVCKEKGLSPFAKEIHLTGYYSKKHEKTIYAVITGIDGYRKIAARTGELAGCSAPIYDLKGDGSYKTMTDLTIEKRLPISCTISVWRMKNGEKCEFTATILFNEFASRDFQGNLVQKWGTMPFHMIAKCAEAFALRKGFDDETSGLSIAEEQAAYEDTNVGLIRTPEENEQEMEKYSKFIDGLKKTVAGINEVDALYTEFDKHKAYKDDQTVIDIFMGRKNEILDESGK